MIPEAMKELWDIWQSRKPIAVLCPFHEEKTPSCCLDHKRSIFRCFGCGAKGIMLPDGKFIRSDEESQ